MQILRYSHTMEVEDACHLMVWKMNPQKFQVWKSSQTFLALTQTETVSELYKFTSIKNGILEHGVSSALYNSISLYAQIKMTGVFF